jgi:hypothetical protein
MFGVNKLSVLWLSERAARRTRFLWENAAYVSPDMSNSENESIPASSPPLCD